MFYNTGARCRVCTFSPQLLILLQSWLKFLLLTTFSAQSYFQVKPTPARVEHFNIAYSKVLAPKPYSPPFIFFLTYKWAQYARVIVTSKPFQPSIM